MRAQIILSGVDAESFLQQLTTNDIRNLSGHLIYSLFLTPQGKLLHDVFITQIENKFIIDCYSEAVNEIINLLNKYKLGSRVEIDISQKLFDLSEYDDPRHKKFGKYAFSNDLDIYYELRYPRLYIDFQTNEYFPFEIGYDQFNCISYNKGCYIGQEVITRTHFRGVIRKKVYAVKVLEKITNDHHEIFLSDQKVGVLLGNYGIKNGYTQYLALMNSEMLEKSNNFSLTLNCKTQIILN